MSRQTDPSLSTEPLDVSEESASTPHRIGSSAPTSPTSTPQASPLAELALTIAEALRLSKAAEELPAVTFSGDDAEDPTLFLGSLHAYFYRKNFNQQQKLQIAARQLRGEALKWWESQYSLDPSFENFALSLDNEYNKPSRRARILADVYRTSQQSSEPAGVFLKRKIDLLKRVNNKYNDAEMVEVLKDLLKPETRRSLWNCQPATIEELFHLACKREAIVAATKPPHCQCSCNQPKSKTSRSPSTPISSTSTASEPQKPKPSTTYRAKQPKCWYCPEFHLHKDCPVLQKRKTESWRKKPDTEEKENSKVAPEKAAPDAAKEK